MRDDDLTGRRSWLWIGLVWAALGIAQASQTVFGMRAAGMHHAWLSLFAAQVLNSLPWPLATPLIMRLARRYRPSARLHRCLLHGGALLALVLLASLWAAVLEQVLQPWAPDDTPQPFLHVWGYKVLTSLLSSSLLYTLIVSLSLMLESRQRLARHETEAARLSEQLSIAQLQALRRQIEPHFIFNALNSVAALVREVKTDAAVSMIARLSDVLRRLVRESQDSYVSLSRDVEFLENYLQIQGVRFAGRLRASITVPEELRRAQVPSLILQPLVENAIKHGIANRVQGGEVRVAAARAADRLTLSVYNDGPPLPAHWQGNGGVGLANIRTRLALMYGDAGTLTLSDHTAQGVLAAVCLPYRESEEA